MLWRDFLGKLKGGKERVKNSKLLYWRSLRVLKKLRANVSKYFSEKLVLIINILYNNIFINYINLFFIKN
jgi:hypothetical protein